MEAGASYVIVDEKEYDTSEKSILVEDVLQTLLAEVGQSMPVLKQILIDERDQYLAEKIRNAPGNNIVAVVGAGHVSGIKEHWKTEIDLQHLDQLPPRNRMAGASSIQT